MLLTFGVIRVDPLSFLAAVSYALVLVPSLDPPNEAIPALNVCPLCKLFPFEAVKAC